MKRILEDEELGTLLTLARRGKIIQSVDATLSILEELILSRHEIKSLKEEAKIGWKDAISNPPPDGWYICQAFVALAQPKPISRIEILRLNGGEWTNERGMKARPIKYLGLPPDDEADRGEE